MLTGADIQSLKDYVSNNDGGMQAQGESTVRLHVTHSNLSAIFFDIRLDRHVSTLPFLHKSPSRHTPDKIKMPDLMSSNLLISCRHLVHRRSRYSQLATNGFASLHTFKLPPGFPGHQRTHWSTDSSVLNLAAARSCNICLDTMI